MVTSASTPEPVRGTGRFKEASAMSSPPAPSASSQAAATAAVGERRPFSRLLICPADVRASPASSLRLHLLSCLSSRMRTPKSAAREYPHPDASLIHPLAITMMIRRHPQQAEGSAWPVSIHLRLNTAARLGSV